MPKYKVYVLQDDGHVISRVDVFCDGGAGQRVGESACR
jgi:hypothetical protein